MKVYLVEARDYDEGRTVAAFHDRLRARDFVEEAERLQSAAREAEKAAQHAHNRARDNGADWLGPDPLDSLHLRRVTWTWDDLNLGDVAFDVEEVPIQDARKVPTLPAISREDYYAAQAARHRAMEALRAHTGSDSWREEFTVVEVDVR
jgi:hypothetical protein